jgi:peptidoglycan/LPS O-acetylase OafA/YrhL
MRRDLVRWFLFGMVCSAVIVGVAMLLGQGAQTATISLLTFYLLFMLGVLVQRYRQRAWRRKFGLNHDGKLYSHEMRCRMAKNLRRMPVSTIAGRSQRISR